MSQSVQPVFDRLKARAKIKAAGKNPSKVAKEMGYERQTVGHWLRGRGEPTMKQIYEMAQKINCHWLELVSDDATILNDPVEKSRVERMRTLDPATLALIDSLLDAKGQPGT